MAGLLDYLEAIGETGAMLGTGAVSGAVGMPYGVYKGIRSGKYGTPEGVRIAEEEARRFMERNTYQPRSQMAQNAIGYAGGLLSDARIPPIIPEAAALSAIPLRPAARMAGEGVAATGRFVAPKAGLLAEEYMQGIGAMPGIIDPSLIKTFPKRMAATNKAIQTGGDIANATARDYTRILEAGKEAVRKGEAGSLQEATKLAPNEVKQRYELANAVLNQPIEKYVPPSYGLLDRSVMSQSGNIGGIPGVTQADINRYVPARADLSYINSLSDPRNLDIIKRSVERGLGATGGGFYKSYQPMRAALDEANYAPDVFNKGLAATSFASAQNSVALENAIGSLIMRMEQSGIPITRENVLKAHDEFKALNKGGLSMMEGHYAPFAKFLEQGFPSGEKQAQKISSFYQNKTGNFRPYVFDTHEAAGTTYATPYGPYFWGQGGAKDTEYGALESLLQQKIAAPMNLDPAIAQEGRWFGLGELTGLKTGGGDWLDNYEKQAAYSAQQLGKELTRKEQQRYVADVFAGKERMLPWWKKDQPIPDVRKKR